MGKFSTYRYLELIPEPSQVTVRGRSLKQPRRLKRFFIFLVIFVLFGTSFIGLFAGRSQWFDTLAKSLGYESELHYAVIIDAGSSGSRVLAYKFRVPFSLFGPKNLDLMEEYFEQSKPGLSSYADDPAKGADTIVRLIKNAEHLIPAERRKDTPLLVRATAGLRLLPQEKAQALIDQVSISVGRLGYNTSANSVEIMHGSDEGIFIWYTLNLLHGLIPDGETMAALDLGGGSTQITYQLDDKDLKAFPSKDQYVVAAGKNITLYTHSYLNLGLLAARYGVLRLEANNTSTDTFTSVCVEPIVQKEVWTYANKQYTVSGSSRQGIKRLAVYERCHKLVRKYVMETLDFEPKEPPRGKVAAMSYFYDIAADSGLIDVEKGGTASVAQYRGEAVRACSASNVDQPWACLDMVYVVTLLQDAYKMHDKHTVSLFKKVDGHEVSWALGLAYTTVMSKLAAALGA